tara:strand:+ start:89 stop:361 length:273 start_codon:yes stop_codon:yes gene_type:complete
MSELFITMPGLEAVAAVVALSTTVLPLDDATVLELLDTVLLTVDDVTVSTAHAGDDSAVARATTNMPVFFRMFPRSLTPGHVINACRSLP